MAGGAGCIALRDGTASSSQFRVAEQEVSLPSRFVRPGHWMPFEAAASATEDLSWRPSGNTDEYGAGETARPTTMGAARGSSTSGIRGTRQHTARDHAVARCLLCGRPSVSVVSLPSLEAVGAPPAAVCVANLRSVRRGSRRRLVRRLSSPRTNLGGVSRTPCRVHLRSRGSANTRGLTSSCVQPWSSG
jgi:hypothetical protein